MAAETFETLYNKVIGHCPLAPISLARTWVNDSFRDLAEKRRWSWLVKWTDIVIPNVYNTGTASAVYGSPTVTGVGTAWDSSMVGSVIRINGVRTGIYTIISVNAGLQTITMDRNWPLPSTGAIDYEIYKCYFTPPSDWLTPIAIIDPVNNYRLNLHVQSSELAGIDAQRSISGDARMVASATYDAAGVPRYELWPHVKTQRIYPTVYQARPTDLSDTGTLPYAVPGDVILTGALRKAAAWPGPTLDKRNPYFQLHLAEMLKEEWIRRVAEIERQDDEIYEADASYDRLPYAPMLDGSPMDSKYWQSHAGI